LSHLLIREHLTQHDDGAHPHVHVLQRLCLFVPQQWPQLFLALPVVVSVLVLVVVVPVQLEDYRLRILRP
jgi:hypothetical protein